MAGKWPYKRVEEIALKVAMGPFGSSIKVETFTDTGIPIISGQHLRDAELTDSEFNFITEEHADSLKNANVQRGDVIFSRSPAMQKPHTAANANVSRRLAVLCGTDLFSNVATPTFRMAALWFYPAGGGVGSAFSNGLHSCRSGE